MSHAQEVVKLRARVEQLEDVLGAMYQFAGAVGAPLRVLDALWASAQGQAVDTGTLLPVHADECEEILTLKRQLEAVRRIVAIGPAAVELGRLGGSRTSPSKRRAARANGLKGGRPRKSVAA